jgi:hypothetical protein
LSPLGPISTTNGPAWEAAASAAPRPLDGSARSLTPGAGWQVIAAARAAPGLAAWRAAQGAHRQGRVGDALARDTPRDGEAGADPEAGAGDGPEAGSSSSALFPACFPSLYAAVQPRAPAPAAALRELLVGWADDKPASEGGRPAADGVALVLPLAHQLLSDPDPRAAACALAALAAPLAAALGPARAREAVLPHLARWPVPRPARPAPRDAPRASAGARCRFRALAAGW